MASSFGYGKYGSLEGKAEVLAENVNPQAPAPVATPRGRVSYRITTEWDALGRSTLVRYILTTI